MPKQGNALSLADRYDLSDLEPDVDPEKAAAYLAGGAKPARKEPEQKPKSASKPKQKTKDKTPTTEASVTNGHAGVGATPEKQPMRTDVWTSRTIRLRQSTAHALTKAACGQKTKQVEGKLKAGEAITVQEIAERGIRLALIELGYLKK